MVESKVHERVKPIVTITTNIVNAIDSVVTQTIEGTGNLAETAQVLLSLITDFGGNRSPDLRSALMEVEDPDAREADRVVSRQKVKGFLLKLSGKVGDAVLDTALKYLNTKLGI
jgi:hypothetical protein